MFEKLKEMAQMRQEAAKLDGMLKEQRIEHTGAHGKIKITMNGKSEIIDLTIHPDLFGDTERLPALIKDAVNDATQTAQKQMAKMMAKFM